jgi:hypothetical protein
MAVRHAAATRTEYVARMPRDGLSIVVPVVPPTAVGSSMHSSITLKVSGWMRKSASTKQRISPRAARAPPLRTAAITRFSTFTERLGLS